MKEIPVVTPLRRITDAGKLFKAAAELTSHLHDESTRSMLRSRYLLGTLKQYSQNHGQSFLELNRLRTASHERKLGAFLLRRQDGVAIGLATVQPALELRRYRSVLGFTVPVAPRLAHRTPLVANNTPPGSFVEAWTAAGYTDEIREAYELLASPTGIAREHLAESTSWTVEPKDAPTAIHAALKYAGFTAITEGHFEHDSKRFETPPHSVLYQRAVPQIVT